MLVSKEQYLMGGESICRNPSLQTMFSLIGAVEKAGSGADTIMLGWKDGNFDTPIITEKSEPNKVELLLPIVPIISNDGINNAKDISGVNNANGVSSVNDAIDINVSRGEELELRLYAFLKLLRIYGGYFGHYHPAVTAITTQFLGRDCTHRANAVQS